MLLLMHHDTPLAISSNEIHEMRATLIDAGIRAAGIPDIDVVRAFAREVDLVAFLRKMRTGDARPQSQCDPMNDPSSMMGAE